jgi:hypothetical protein
LALKAFLILSSSDFFMFNWSFYHSNPGKDINVIRIPAYRMVALRLITQRLAKVFCRIAVVIADDLFRTPFTDD